MDQYETTSGMDYAIVYREDGVFAQISWDADELVPAALVFHDIKRRGIQGSRPVEIAARLRQKVQEVRLGPAQEAQSAPSCAFVALSADKMTARMTLLAPAGDGAALDTLEIIDQVHNEWGVTTGVDTALIRTMVENQRYYRTVEIARGTPAEKGADGRLEYLFKTNHTFTPKLLDDGRVDYHDLDTYSRVEAGDGLVRRIPPHEGVDGVNVMGEVVPGIAGAQAKMPKAKGAHLSPDESTLVADKSGRVDIVNHQVEVSDIYSVNGDVDLSTGDIDFPGDVRIWGNVISGMTVKASGSIEVNGTVEAATLIAGSDILLKKGIQGMDKGSLVAGGNIISRFIERCTAQASHIHADYIVHSQVSARERIELKGKHGRAAGGTLRAGRMVSARTIGSPGGDRTEVEVGILPETQTKLKDLETERTQLKAQLDRLAMLGEAEPADPARREIWQKLVAGRDGVQAAYDKVNDDIAACREAMSRSSGGKVHVTGVVYQGVRIVIDQAPYMVPTSLEYATFKYRDGNVAYTACEIGL